jgi:polyferredoxin
MSLHSICPYGGVVTLVTLLKYGVFVKQIHESSVVMLALIMMLGVLFGPVVCSYMCPLGSIQEWIGKLGRKIFKKRYNNLVPENLDKILRYTRYFFLIFTVYVTTNSLRLMFLNIDPYYALFNFWSDEVVVGGLVVLVVTLLGSLFIERPWCKYACPYGALLGITNLFSVFAIRRGESTCKSCDICTHECPMNIPVHAVKVVRDHQCIGCLECTSEAICPIENTVIFATKGNL